MHYIIRLSLTVLWLCNTLPMTESSKILAIFPFPGPSQYILVLPYLKKLASLGHELTVINTHPQKQKIPNFRDVPVMDIHKTYDNILADAVQPRSKWQASSFFSEFFTNATLNVLRDPAVKKLMKSKAKFDLIIVEALQTDALYAFGAYYNAPIIGISTYGTDWNIDHLVGNTSPISYIPSVTSGFTDHMTFLERLENLASTTFDWTHQNLVHLPTQERIYKHYFPDLKAPLSEIRKNFSLILLNQHFSLSFPRPYVPNMVEVGGMHIQHEPAPLPIDMEAFINGATDGAIYFSLGSNIKSKDLPSEKLALLLRIFGSLKQRVLWKFEEPNLPGKPANVYINSWFPQPDVLAHPNVKIFITHGGLLSTIEAIYHGKPIIGFPVFYDQFLNVERAKQAGFGLGLDFHNMNGEKLKHSIDRLLNEPSFGQIAAERSQRYRDQPQKPLDTAIYWTEYVIRHRGARHMRVAAQDMSFIAYHSIDTCLVLFGGFGLVLILVLVVVFKLTSMIFENKSRKLKTN